MIEKSISWILGEKKCLQIDRSSNLLRKHLWKFFQSNCLSYCSSAFASLLNHAEGTFHSLWKVLCYIDQVSVFLFTKCNAKGLLMQKTSLSVRREVFMGHKHVFECLDWPLLDLRTKESSGGLTFCLAG